MTEGLRPFGLSVPLLESVKTNILSILFFTMYFLACKTVFNKEETIQ